MSGYSYSEEEILEEIRRVSEEYCNGETPSNKKFREYGDICASLVADRFGSWNEGIDKAGLNRNVSYDFTEEDLLEDIQRVSIEELEGKTPTYSEYQKHGEYSSNTVDRNVGSWNDALRKCGFEIHKEDKIDDETLIEDINRVFEQHSEGHYPTLGDVDKHGNFPKITYRKHFGGWTEALIASGFENPYPTGWPLSGEEHPAWNDESRSQGYGPSWYKQRKKALKRDNHSCRICGDGKEEIGMNPAVHHIRPKYMWNVEEEHEEMNSLNNLVTLCYSHHHLLEGEFKNSSSKEFVEKACEKYE